MVYSYLLIDCSSLCYGSAFTLKGLRTDEIETGVIFGFLGSILFLSEKFKTNKFAFCWDSKGSERAKIFPDYKKKRKEKKEDPEVTKLFQSIYKQMGKLQNDIMPHIGFNNNFFEPGYEADDIIADLVLGYENCLMVTKDEDMFQLLELADMWKPTKEELWTEDKFRKVYGINPYEWILVKAIGGCTSDEIPGIQGVREKTAIKYLKKELKNTTKSYQNIKNGKEIIKRNLKLVSLPFVGTPEHIIRKDKFSMTGLQEICKEYWLESFTTKLGTARWENLFSRRL